MSKSTELPHFDATDPFAKVLFTVIELLKDDEEWREALLEYIRARTRLTEANTLLRLDKFRASKPSKPPAASP